MVSKRHWLPRASRPSAPAPAPQSPTQVQATVPVMAPLLCPPLRHAPRVAVLLILLLVLDRLYLRKALCGSVHHHPIVQSPNRQSTHHSVTLAAEPVGRRGGRRERGGEGRQPP